MPFNNLNEYGGTRSPFQGMRDYTDSDGAISLDNVNVLGNKINQSNGNFSSSPDMGFHKFNTRYVLRDYFKDRDTFNFKYGLEVGLNSNLNSKSTGHATLNLDEDPTIFGFDLVILNGSPLFNEIDDFMEFGRDNNIRNISQRRDIYLEFINQFSKFFNVDDRNKGYFKTNDGFNSFKTHYIHGISGLSNLIHHTGVGYEGGKQMSDYGTDKITIRLTEDIGINSGYLSAIYRSLIYSKINGRMVIPENLLRFDMSIIISEVRNMNRVSNALSKSMRNDRELIPILNDNVSRYIFTLYDCQFNFNNYSFGDDITQGGFGGDTNGVSDGIGIDVYYKYVEMEMEKFEFRPDINDIARYVNDSKVNPTSYQVNPDLDSSINELGIDKFPNRPLDRKFQMNTTSNSNTTDRLYEFDFPMMNPKYVKSNIDARDKRESVLSSESIFKKGLNKVIDTANQKLQTKFTEHRTQLLSGLTSKIREKTGIRNITSPVNVYEGTNLGQFALDQLHNFVNLGVGTLLSTGAGYMGNLSKDVENSVFDVLNRGADALKGHSGLPNRNRNPLGGGDIPNVYRNN